MSLLENVVLTESVEIRTTPEAIFASLASIRDDASYRAWHPKDHVAFRWLKGEPWQQGSVAYAEEYLHGKLHKRKFRVKSFEPNRRIEYVPLPRLLRIYFPGNTFEVEQEGETCRFTATVRLRVGRLARRFAGPKLEFAMSSIQRHMREEGEYLKGRLEDDGPADAPESARDA
jgi:hypothetical protein